MSSLALKARKGTPGGGGTMPTPMGSALTVTVATTVLVAVSITETVLGRKFAT